MNILQKILGKYYQNDYIRVIAELIFIVIPIAFTIRTFIFGLYQVPSGSMETTLLVGERFFADKLSYWFTKPKRGDIIAFNDPKYPYSNNQIVKLWQKYFSWNVSNWTKRVIAIPGDHIKGTIENGTPVIYLNGKKLDESEYVNKYPLIATSVNPYYLNGELIKFHFKSYDPNLPYDKQPFYNIDKENIILDVITKKPIIRWPYTPNEGGSDIFEYKLGPNEYFVRGDNRKNSSDSSCWGLLNGELIHGKIVFRIWSMDTDEPWLLIDLIKNPIKFWKKVRWSRCLNLIK